MRTALLLCASVLILMAIGLFIAIFAFIVLEGTDSLIAAPAFALTLYLVGLITLAVRHWIAKPPSRTQ